jgi:hypothetical protein
MSPIQLVNRFVVLLFVLLGPVLLDGCTAIKGIFKAGFWAGAVVVIIGLAIVGGLAWLASRATHRGPPT